ncbi:MAG: ATP-binding cassette domain-containing protein [Candidatus Eisenbacteria bacterium]
MDVFRLEKVQVIKSGKPVLESLDWCVADGRTSTILGPSGSGKTSVLRLLNRLDDPASGRVLYKDKPISSWDVCALRREVGMVFQRPELFEGTVEANLRFGPALHDIHVDIGEVMSLVGLDAGMLEQDARSLSGGEAQKVSIGRAISVGPKVLLLDEPTSGLDPTACLQIEELVKRLVKTLGLTCIFVTHYIEQAKRMGDAAILLISGRKVEEGPMSDFLDHPQDARTLKFIRGELK